MPKTAKISSVTIAIPAHNEAENVGYMLQSVAKQRFLGFELAQVLVICDGCTDDTAKIARSFRKKLPQLQVFDDGKRTGKAERLNQLFSKNTSDFIVTLDADLVLAGSDTIQLLLAHFADPQIELVGAHFSPVEQSSWMGKFSNVSLSCFLDAAYSWNNGNNFYSMMGGAQAFRKSFARTLRYPKGLVSDQSFTYAAAMHHNPHAFVLAHDARVWCRTVATFHDWRLLGTRSIGRNKADAAQYFGEESLADTHMPKSILFQAILHWLHTDPISTIGAIIMNIFIRVFPLNLPIEDGAWESTVSSKHAIR